MWARLFSWASLGVLIGAHGGPPCNTYSKVRHKPGGPRPVRSCTDLYGLPHLSDKEQKQVDQANLFIRSLCRLFCMVGPHSAVSPEHPDDPGCSPHPSAWFTHEVVHCMSVCKCSHVCFHMCRYGWSSTKPPRVGGGNLLQLHTLRLLCNHGGHPSMSGRDALGQYCTSHAQKYTSMFCVSLANLIVVSIRYLQR